MVKLVILLWITSCSAALAGTSAIVPGKSIGRISLGEHEAQAIKPLGPTDGGDAASGHTWTIWKSPASHAGRQYELDVYTVNREGGLYRDVEQIRVTSPWYKTRHNVSVGSSLAAVKAAFPHIKRFKATVYPSGVKTAMLYDDVNQGISFEFGSAKTASANSEKCRAIMIHRHGSLAFNEAYSWYTPIAPPESQHK